MSFTIPLWIIRTLGWIAGVVILFLAIAGAVLLWTLKDFHLY